jgi:uncharacterized protein YbaR (Trm112 family)
MVPLICPVTREPIELQGDMLVARKSGNSCPVVDGIPVLKYSELNLRQKLSKATLPLHRHVAVRAALTLPRRAVRRLAWAAGGGAPTRLHFGRLKPNYERPLCADSDACSSIDSHEAALFFHSRGYKILSPGSAAGA